MDAALIIETARGYLDTPYHHQGRVKAVGVDCLGLIICVGRDLDFLHDEFDRQDYTHQPVAAVLLAGLRQHLVEVDLSDIRPGDILVLDVSGQPVHLGIRTDIGLLHAYAPAGRVVEHGLRGVFARSVRYAFRVPE